MRPCLLAALALLTTVPASATSPISYGRFGSWEVISIPNMLVPVGHARRPTGLFAGAVSDDHKLRWSIITHGERFSIETVAASRTDCRSVRKTVQHAKSPLSSAAVLAELVRQTRSVRDCLGSDATTLSTDLELLRSGQTDLNKALAALNSVARRVYR